MLMPASTWKMSTMADISPSTTTLTTDYTGWVSDWFTCRGFDQVAFYLTIVKGDSTTITVLLEAEDMTGTDGFEDWKIAADGTPSKDEIPITSSDLSATHRMVVQQSVLTFPRIRLKAKKTGGSGTATLTCEVVGA